MMSFSRDIEDQRILQSYWPPSTKSAWLRRYLPVMSNSMRKTKTRGTTGHIQPSESLGCYFPVMTNSMQKNLTYRFHRY